MRAANEPGLPSHGGLLRHGRNAGHASRRSNSLRPASVLSVGTGRRNGLQPGAMRSPIVPGRSLAIEFGENQSGRIGSAGTLPRCHSLQRACPIFLPIVGPRASEIPSLSRHSYLDFSLPSSQRGNFKASNSLEVCLVYQLSNRQGDSHEAHFRHRFSRTHHVRRSPGDNRKPARHRSSNSNLLQRLLRLRLRLLLTGRMLRLIFA